MHSYPTKQEIKERISRHLQKPNENYERISICWDGYLAALLEWGLISVQDHAELAEMLIKIEKNPVIDIFLGTEL